MSKRKRRERVDPYTGRAVPSLSELQVLNSQEVPTDQEKAYWQEVADYELEISICTPYDEIDEVMARFYPNVIGNGHPDVCLCPACAPGEYT